MEVVVNDTNIFIDLYNADLLKYCNLMSLEFHTLSVIIAEILDVNEREYVEKLISKGTLKVKNLTDVQLTTVLEKVQEFSGKNNLSLPDISVMIYAKDNNFRLLTGDKILRNQAQNEGVTVSGVLYLTEQMVLEGIVDPLTMASSLERMISINRRLPEKYIRNKINILRNEIKNLLLKGD